MRNALTIVAAVSFLLGSEAVAQHEGVVPESRPRSPDFARDVQPILAQHCYRCHGPDEKARKAKLRLDLATDAFAGRTEGAAFVPGSLEKSMAYARVVSTDEFERMPPADAGAALSKREIETLGRWIEGGAVWSVHWSFAAPQKPIVPEGAGGAWARNPIDAFVARHRDGAGIPASAEATREAWLRRATIDLTGVPPTLEEIDAFLADKSADAFEKVVDRLLASPRYGERQAAEWLDLARYADTSGYQRDTVRTAWKWREWVVNAFNSGMPYDRFTVEQLAGDLLPNPTLDQRIATGFNRNHPTNTEAGEEEDEYRSAYVIDRVHTTATTWLGLTLACAQCHDHKYDPISQRDFYEFYAFFNNVKERDSDGFGANPKPSIPAPNPDQTPHVEDVARTIKALEARLEANDPLVDAGQAAWEAATRARLGRPFAWTTLEPAGVMARHGSLLRRLDDGSILASGPTPVRETYELVFSPGKKKIGAFRIEVLPDPSLPRGASGRADDGRFVLSSLEIRHATVADSEDPPLVGFALAAADLNQKFDPDTFNVVNDIAPGDVQTAVAGAGGARRFGGGWCIAGAERFEAHEAVFVPIEPIETNDVSILRFTLAHTSKEKFRASIGRFRISFTEDPRVRTLLVPVTAKPWKALGPFPAETVDLAHAVEFAPEKDLKSGELVKKTYEQPTLEPKKDGKAELPPKTAAESQPTSAPAASQPAPTEGAASKPAKDGAKDDKPKIEEKKKPKKLVWAEKIDWHAGTGIRVPIEGAASAWFATRKLLTERARTVTIEIDGADGLKVWLNGESVFAEEPPAVKEDDGKKAPVEAEEGFDFAAFFGGASASSPKAKKFRLGLRSGENELVVKMSHRGKKVAKSGEAEKTKPPAEAPPELGMKGGPGAAAGTQGLFAFVLIPEGDDLLDYETLRALERAETNEPPVATAKLASVSTAPGAVPESRPATSEARAKAVRRFYRTRIDLVGRTVFEELERKKEEKRRLEKKIPQALVMEELPESRPTHVFVRGQYKQKGERVQAGVPKALPPLPADAPRNRLGLANWMISRANPLTARVAMNRLWQQYFGRGFVSSSEDFGIRSDQPSHADLLDWLAVEFMDGGWELKRMHRLVVLSATYRQSSVVASEIRDRDPDNRWFGRGPRRRLAAEMVRDQALFLAGLLVEKIGGPSVKPFQPAGLWRDVAGGGDWKADSGGDQYRRGIYVYWKRGVPYPSFVTFDAAKRETCTVSRPETTTPLQALVLLNDPVYVEAARMFGRRMIKEGGKSDDARLAHGFRAATSRRPVDGELEILRSLLAGERAHWKAAPKAAAELLGVGEAKIDEKIDAVEAAAWAQIAAVILNMDATLRRG